MPSRTVLLIKLLLNQFCYILLYIMLLKCLITYTEKHKKHINSSNNNRISRRRIHKQIIKHDGCNLQSRERIHTAIAMSTASFWTSGFISALFMVTFVPVGKGTEPEEILWSSEVGLAAGAPPFLFASSLMSSALYQVWAVKSFAGTVEQPLSGGGWWCEMSKREKDRVRSGVGGGRGRVWMMCVAFLISKRFVFGGKFFLFCFTRQGKIVTSWWKRECVSTNLTLLLSHCSIVHFLSSQNILPPKQWFLRI